jgi:hypothetical protein
MATQFGAFLTLVKPRNEKIKETVTSLKYSGTLRIIRVLGAIGILGIIEANNSVSPNPNPQNPTQKITLLSPKTKILLK